MTPQPLNFIQPNNLLCRPTAFTRFSGVGVGPIGRATADLFSLLREPLLSRLRRRHPRAPLLVSLDSALDSCLTHPTLLQSQHTQPHKINNIHRREPQNS